jgi:hypothetical protein
MGLLAIFLIPFATFRDFYPFQRMGMFAYVSAVHDTIVYYEIMLNGKTIAQEYPKSILFEGDKYQYLLRNYVYRKQEKLLLQKVHQTFSIPTSGTLELFECTYITSKSHISKKALARL